MVPENNNPDLDGVFTDFDGKAAAVMCTKPWLLIKFDGVSSAW